MIWNFPSEMFSPRGSVKPSFVSQLIYQTAVWLAVGWLLIGPFIQSASWLVETLVSTLYWPFDQFCFYLDFSTLWSIFWKPQLYVGILLLAPSCWSFDRQPQFVQTLPSLGPTILCCCCSSFNFRPFWSIFRNSRHLCAWKSVNLFLGPSHAPCRLLEQWIDPKLA